MKNSKSDKSQRRVIEVDEKVPFLKGFPLSLQHLFAMFGSSVLVPFLFNQAAGKVVIDPALVLLMNGIGTLIYLFICKGKVPAYLGSSFAFIAPAVSVITSSPDVQFNFQRALGGYIVSGLVFTLVALLIGRVGTSWLDKALPPAAMGPIVALIGLELASTAADMAGLLPKNGVYDIKVITVSIFTLSIVVIGSVAFRGFLGIIPILVAVVSGYVLSAYLGLVNTSDMVSVSWLSIPKFQLPVFDTKAILTIFPAALVVISEHIGHLFVTSNIVGRDLAKDPGLNKSLLGDGVSTMISGFCGSCPTTTYGENIGVMAISKVYSVWVIGGAAIISIAIAFCGKLSALISSIPTPVMGGVSLLLFGVITASGIRMIVEAKIDYSKSKNLITSALVFVTGVSGVSIDIHGVQFKGMVLATVLGIIISLLIHLFDRLNLLND